MTITKTANGKDVQLVLSGRLDTITSVQLSEELDKIFQSGDFNIELDFNDVDYISSAGLRIIINTQKKVGAIETKLVLTRVHGNVKEVLDMTGFSNILNII